MPIGEDDGGNDAENATCLAAISVRNWASSADDRLPTSPPEILGKSWAIHFPPHLVLFGS